MASVKIFLHHSFDGEVYPHHRHYLDIQLKKKWKKRLDNSQWPEEITMETGDGKQDVLKIKLQKENTSGNFEDLNFRVKSSLNIEPKEGFAKFIVNRSRNQWRIKFVGITEAGGPGPRGEPVTNITVGDDGSGG